MKMVDNRCNFKEKGGSRRETIEDHLGYTWVVLGPRLKLELHFNDNLGKAEKFVMRGVLWVLV